jgi:hypothetical protein
VAGQVFDRRPHGRGEDEGEEEEGDEKSELPQCEREHDYPSDDEGGEGGSLGGLGHGQ